jgi:hypothetical protein
MQQQQVFCWIGKKSAAKKTKTKPTKNRLVIYIYTRVQVAKETTKDKNGLITTCPVQQS